MKTKAAIERDGVLETDACAFDFLPPEIPADRVTPATIEAADRIARHWVSTEVGALRAGSEAHKREVCRMFRETFNPYRPSVIAWPELHPEELQRLKSLPIWDIALHTEGRARMRFAAYAATLADPDMRDAIMLNAWEENRHKEVLAKMMEAYGIKLVDEPPLNLPRDPEWAFLVTGYSECIDSFFAFGLFDLARQSGFFPAELVETFEPVIQEECRHILLFANWLAWRRANLAWWRRLWFEVRVAAVWIHIAWLRVGLARGIGKDSNATRQGSNFTVEGAQAIAPVDVGIRDLMELCLAENSRRFAGYDSRLVRPTAIPRLVGFACRVAKPWTRQKVRRDVETDHRSPRA
jgi:hypothetical protein